MEAVAECRLCQTYGQLRLSHIIPKFVFPLQKSWSVTALRSYRNPNVPIQDFPKMYFLCGRCEQRLSVWETAFKREIYEPYHAGSLNSVQYRPWLLKFATSLSWRVLKAVSETVDATPEIKRAASPAEKTWSDFLLDKKVHPGPFCQYLFFLDSLAKTPDTSVPINFASAIHRVVAAGIWPGTWRDPRHGSLFTYSMLCSIAIVGLISLGDETSQAWGEHLHVCGGVMNTNGRIPPREVVDMIKAQAIRHLNLSRQRSERQEHLDDTALVTDEEKTLQSGYLHAMALDVARVTKKDPKSLAQAVSRGVAGAQEQKPVKLG
jgi:hypothetical protein